jgi:hypothetical protein
MKPLIKVVRSVVFIEYSGFLLHYITEIFLKVALNIITLTPLHSHGGMQADRKIEE